MCSNNSEKALPTSVMPNEDQQSYFMRLSNDLLHIILDDLNFSHDLYPLLFVSKALYELTLSHLYRRVDLSILASGMSYTLVQMLNRGNRGLNHIRELVLWDADEDSCRQPAKMGDYNDAALLAYLLPNDTLTRFEWRSWHALPPPVYQTVLSHQRNLTSLELNWSGIPTDDMLKHGSKSLLRDFEKVNRLRIMPGIDESVPRAALDFFRSHPGIQHLTLDFWHMQPIRDQDQAQKAAQTGKAGLKPFFTGLGLYTFRLRSLTLADVDLRGCHCEWISVLSFDLLSELTLSNCIHPQDFLTAVTTATTKSPIRLERFVLYQSQAWDDVPGSLPSPLVGKVDKFLDGISKSLRDLWICLRGFTDVPDAATIAKHGETLLWLFLDVREGKGGEVVIYPFGEWQMLCQSLVKVQQVDVVYPYVEADYQIDNHPMFHDYVEATVSIPTVRFLGVNNWPSSIVTGGRTDYFTGLSVANYAAHNHLLAQLATDILDMSEANLAAITFGILERITAPKTDEKRFSPMHFGKSRVEVLGGEQKMKMEPVERWVLDKLTGRTRCEFDVDDLAHEFSVVDDGGDVRW